MPPEMRKIDTVWQANCPSITAGSHMYCLLIPTAQPIKSEYSKPLHNLMFKDDVSDMKLQNYCYRMGYCSAATPATTYPSDFTAYLVTTGVEAVSEIGNYEKPVPFN